jgi:hypothetical protein
MKGTEEGGIRLLGMVKSGRSERSEHLEKELGGDWRGIMPISGKSP